MKKRRIDVVCGVEGGAGVPVLFEVSLIVCPCAFSGVGLVRGLVCGLGVVTLVRVSG